MSLYPSQSSYGHPSYSQYTQPVAHGGYYHQYQLPPPPPPQPVYPLDPASFRREYTNRLNALTVNSRPIIQDLSMLAQEYSRFAEIVAQCLESHIRRVPPWLKLPAFYLLDAISKNVYEPYARHFAVFVIPLFLETYGLVDEGTRGKMEEMLLTWRTGSPQNKELFGVPPQVAIERGIWGDAGIAHNAATSPSDVTRSRVLYELDGALHKKKQAVNSNPYDTTSQNHITVLAQLRKLVEAGVSSNELYQILNQLRTLVNGPASPPQARPPQWQPQPSYSAPTLTQLPFPPSVLPTFPHLAQVPSSYPADGMKLEQPLATTSTSTPSSTLGVQPQASIANLLSTLLKAGVVSTNSTPTGAGATVKEEASKQLIGESKLEREASRAYRQVILSQPIKLSSSEIMRTRPQIVELLYEQLTAQCKQCGIRFADTIVGKKDMEDHLDMHFRQNRKANLNVGRGHSRSWFIGVEDWIHDLSIGVKGKGRADGSLPLNPKAAAAAEAARRDAELRALFVVVPPGDEAKTISCPICKENLKSEFLDDDEEWVWKNAVKKDDRVYHATCHAEAVVSTNSLAARLRTTAGRSRSGTPEASLSLASTSVSRTTPPPATLRNFFSQSPSHESKLAGTKRKVDENDSVLTGEVDGTPPSKRLALSSLTTMA